MATFDLRHAEKMLSNCKYDECFSYCSSFKDDADAMELLSRCYQYGYGVPENIHLSIRWCTLALEHGCNRAEKTFNTFSNEQIITAYYYLAQEGDSYSALCLAMEYLTGRRVNLDRTEARLWLEQAAVDYPKAQYELGICYETGMGAEKNLEKAIDLFISAHEKGYPPAKQKLSSLAQHTAGIKNLIKAAENGIPDAIFELGQTYEYGYGIETDKKYAFELYHTAESNGFAKALFRLGFMYENGLGTPKKEKRSFEMYSLAAKKSDQRANISVARLLENGIGTKKDIDKAIKIYEYEAKKGSIVATYHLAICFINGTCQSSAAKQAYEALYNNSLKYLPNEAKLYIHDANDGDARSQFYMGLIYEHTGNADDFINAYEQYKLSADQNFIPACYRLGLCYEFGKGTAMNEEAARIQYETAAENNYIPACYRLAMLYSNTNPARSAELFTTAANAGHAPSMCILSLLYDIGYGVEPSSDKAHQFAKKAFTSGSTITQSDINGCYSKENIEKSDYLCGLMYEAQGISYIEAYEKYKSSAAVGFTPAIFRMAELYADSKPGINQTPSLAFDLYAAAAENGYLEALYKLGYCYENGFGTSKDLNAAFECYTAAAQNGNSSAQFALGRFYEQGMCCLQDKSEAFDWYRRAGRNGHTEARAYIENHAHSMKLFGLNIHAAKKGDPKAEYELGKAYETGDAIEKNITEAYKWYMLSAEHGYSQAQYTIGISYITGDNLKFNRTVGIRWLKKAAYQGHSAALAYLHEHELEKEAFAAYKATLVSKSDARKSVLRNIKIVKELAEKGKAWAAYTYAVYFDENYQESAEPEYDKAVKWFEVAAKNGHVYSMFELAEHKRLAKGTKRDLSAASKLYGRSAMQGYKFSSYMMGVCYEYGFGFNRNLDRAMQWYEQAVKYNIPEAMVSLGKLYEQGIVISRDIDKAHKLYTRAASLGSVEANYRLYLLYKKNGYNNLPKKDKIYFCKIAAEQGYSFAQLEYGTLLLHGTQVERDENLAFTYLSRAAKVGNPMAKYLIGLCYSNSIGISSKSTSKQKEAYYQSSQMDNSRSQYTYSMLYEDKTQSYFPSDDSYLFKAARNGEPHALKKLKEYKIENLTEKLWGIDENQLHVYARDAAHGDSYAQYLTALCIEQGIGIDKDVNKAILIYKNAAENGCIDAMYRLYVLFCSGSITEYDGEAAYYWCRLAAERGHPMAQFIIGCTSPDISESMYFYREAAFNGIVSAQLFIGNKCMSYKASAESQAEAYMYYSLAAEKANPLGLFKKAQCLENGYGTEKDIDSAIYYYELSQKAGFAPAAKYLNNIKNRSDKNNKEND